MGKGDLNFKVSADPEKAIADLAKVISKQEAMIGKLRLSNREAKKVQKSFGGFGKVAADVGKIAGGFMGAQGAIRLTGEALQLLTSHFEDLSRKEKEAADASINYTRDFSNIISTWLGTEHIDKAHHALREAVKDIPELGYTAGKEMLAAFGAAIPKASLEEGIAAVRLAAPLTWEKRPEVIKLVGELMEVFPQKELEDIFDIALMVRTAAGKNINLIAESMRGIHQLKAYGIGGETGLGTMLAMMERELKPRAMTTMLSILARPIAPVKKAAGKPLTETQRIQNELAALGMDKTAEEAAAARFDWIRQNAENYAKAQLFYGTTFAPVAPAFVPGAIAGGTMAVRRAQMENYYRSQLEAAQNQALVKITGVDFRREAAKEAQQLEYGKGAAIGSTARYTRELLESLPTLGKTRRDLILKTIEFKGRMGNEYVDETIKGLKGLQEQFAAPMKPRAELSRRYGYFPALPRPNPLYDPAAGEAIGNLITDLREMQAAYKSMTQPQGGVSNEQLEANTRAMKDLTDALQQVNQSGLTRVPFSSGVLD